MEISAAETVVTFDVYNTHTSITPAVFSVELSANTLDDQGKFKFTVDGSEVEVTSSFATTFTYPGTTLELSFSSRQVAFPFTGEATTTVIILGEHTHVTVDGIETAIELPGLTTELTVSSASNVIVGIPATTTQMTIPEAAYVFSVINTIVTDENKKYCGDDTAATFAADAGSTGAPCVLGTTFTVTLPSDASALYLNVPGLTTSFVLEGITTTFFEEQNVAITLENSN